MASNRVGNKPRTLQAARGAPYAPVGNNKPRRKRKTPFSKVLLSLALKLAILAAVVGAGYIYFDAKLSSDGPLQEAKTIEVKRGQKTAEIGKMLEEAGVISNSQLFVVASQIKRMRRGGSLKAGEYIFEKNASMRQVLNKIRSGRGVVFKVTVPEGYTSQQVVDRLNENEALTGEITEIPPEGSLLPETYTFAKRTDRNKIIKRMQLAQNKMAKDLWEARQPGLPFETLEEAIILASIVEKETGLADERRKVAAVFVNRLRKKMRLQSDPTIIYGIVKGKGKLDRPIRKSDIREKTAYNTYQIDGLPPTPIANPGKAALAAVLNPVESSALYFVADGTGGHAFADSLKEHVANVKNWRKIEKQRRETLLEAAGVKDKDEEEATDETVEDTTDENADQSATVDEAKPEEDAAENEATPEADQATKKIVAPVPGSVVKIANRLVPIPRPKPKRN